MFGRSKKKNTTVSIPGPIPISENGSSKAEEIKRTLWQDYDAEISSLPPIVERVMSQIQSSWDFMAVEDVRNFKLTS